MKKYLVFILMLPIFCFAQVKTSTGTTKKQVAKSNVDNTIKKQSPGFIINGNISGYPDGTAVKLLNANTGAAEQTTLIEKNKFILTGKMNLPDFKVLQVNNEQRYITLFLDNNSINLTAQKDSIPKAIITGSPSQDEFQIYSDAIKPYEGLLNQQGNYSAAFLGQAVAVLEKFVAQHPASFISPLAIYRQNQLTSNPAKLEEMYNSLAASVKASPIANYLAQQIEENKKSALGRPLPDFSQADTSGIAVKLSSFKGKYVLVDFWASWCGPCRAENPNVVRMYRQFKDKNFTVLGVSLDKSKEPWLNAIHADCLAWTQVSDLQGWNNAVAQQFNIQSIPQNYLLDPQGNVIGKNLRGSALEFKLMGLLQ